MFFSVIIPTYNSTRLDKLLDSLLNQNIQKDLFEVVIVDDCSPDKTFLSILDDYSNKLNIRLIENQTNLKQGLARQVGIDNAKGDWLTFVDHDDILLPGSLLQVYNEINLNDCKYMFNTDMVVSNNEDFYKYLEPKNHGVYGIQNSDGCLHGKFFNRNFLNKNGIRFHNQIFGNEDTYFLTVVFGITTHDMLENPKVNYRVDMPIITYVWFLWSDSLSHTKFKNMTYLEHTFGDYMQACFDGWLFLQNMYHDVYLAFGKLLSLIMYGYWLCEGFDYDNYNPYSTHEKHDTSQNFKILRRYQEKIFSILKIKDVDHFLKILHFTPNIYGETFNLALEEHGRSIIPQYTIEQRFRMIEKMPSELTEKDKEQIDNIYFLNLPPEEITEK